MPIKKHERDVLYFDVVVGARAEQATPPPMREVVHAWAAATAMGMPPKEFEAGSVTATINHVAADLDTDTVTILIQVSDRNAPNSTYVDHRIRSSRTFPKRRSEGNAYSAHLVISLLEQRGGPNSYLAVLEAIPTIAPLRVQSILNSALSHICKESTGMFVYAQPGGVRDRRGRAKTKPFVPHVLFHGHPSAEFVQDLEHGKILGLKLLRPQERRPLGGSPYLQITDLQLTVKVDQNIPVGERFGLLMEGIQAQQDNYSSARISVQPQRGGRSYSVDLDTRDGTIMSERHIKSFHVSPINPMMESNCSETVVPHFEAILKGLVTRDRQV